MSAIASPPTERMTSLYRSLLGGSFDLLPPVLQEFHGSEDARAAGTVRVTRGRGRIGNLLADLLRLPRAGAVVPVDIHVLRQDVGERWVRRFGASPLESLQRPSRELLLESFGPLRLRFRLQASAGGLRFEPAGARFLFIPLPRRLAPEVRAEERGGDGGWRVEVRVRAPILGEVLRYEGEVTRR